jgi:hypothetical protein
MFSFFHALAIASPGLSGRVRASSLRDREYRSTSTRQLCPPAHKPLGPRLPHCPAPFSSFRHLLSRFLVFIQLFAVSPYLYSFFAKLSARATLCPVACLRFIVLGSLKHILRQCAKTMQHKFSNDIISRPSLLSRDFYPGFFPVPRIRGNTCLLQQVFLYPLRGGFG